MKNSEQPAFPLILPIEVLHEGKFYDGLTKREYFTALAMQGILSNPTVVMNVGRDGKDNNRLSIAAVAIADALLEELEKELPQDTKQQ